MKSLKIILISFVVGMSLLITGSILKGCSIAKQQTATKAAKTALSHPQAAPTKTYKDATGNTHVQIPSAVNQVSKKSLKDSSITNHTLIDSTAKQLKIKDEQIAELTRVNLKLTAAIQLTPAGVNIFSYADDHLQLTYYTLSNKALLNYHVHVTDVKFSPASMLPFSTKPAVLDFSTDDPRAIVDGIDQNSVIAQPPLVGFSSDIKATYMLDTKKIVPAIGANLRVGRWHALYNLYYSNQLRQSVGGAYDLAKINP